MKSPIATTIDAELCTGCGQCISVCPANAISLIDDKAVVTGPDSLFCGHCMAACPTDAISVKGISKDHLKLATVEYDDRYLKPGEFDIPSLMRLMNSRRSCRNYHSKPVPTPALEDLVKIAAMAPSGTNCQSWHFTVLRNRESVLRLCEAVLNFFRRLNRQAESRAMRLLAKVFLKDALGQYYRGYYETVKQGIKDYEEQGKDLLFHGAPAAILIGSRPGATTPKEDALLASQNILLAGHAMGLGTCMIGFAVEAIRNDPTIKDTIGIPRDETIHAAMAVGYPNETYVNTVAKKPIVAQFI